MLFVTVALGTMAALLTATLTAVAAAALAHADGATRPAALVAAGRAFAATLLLLTALAGTIAAVLPPL